MCIALKKWDNKKFGVNTAFDCHVFDQRTVFNNKNTYYFVHVIE
jgi:hypothetical protein